MARLTEVSPYVRIEGRSLWSRNAVKGVSVRGERLKRDGRKEWRQWSPRSSKLAAGLLRSQSGELLASMLPESGVSTLYLGAGHGTTISHLHDHLCASKNHLGGSIVAVDISPRCVRDLIRLARSRPGLLPVLADARKATSITPFLNGRVTWLFQDVSQAGQVEMFITAATTFLAAGGCGLLSLKAASERITEGGHRATFDNAEESLTESGLILRQRLNLTGWEDNHVLFHVEAPADWPGVAD